MNVSKIASFHGVVTGALGPHLANIGIEVVDKIEADHSGENTGIEVVDKSEPDCSGEVEAAVGIDCILTVGKDTVAFVG